ncbi:MAG: hypothetical protein OHK93_001673 [Ramalina farinacea]|uniref:Uncharacterized protein n=1 Tax=Ramalina farinacea TaxID=258253 RepID=A0AA43TXY3_9LECA|nr:hypothetical protein [Ramalina farinacea]
MTAPGVEILPMDAEDMRQDLLRSEPRFQLTDESNGKAVSEASWPEILRVNKGQSIRLALERKKVPSSSEDADEPSEDRKILQKEKPTVSFKHKTDSHSPPTNLLYQDNSPVILRGQEPSDPPASVDPPASTALSVANGASSNHKDSLPRCIESKKNEAHAQNHIEQDIHVALPESSHSPIKYPRPKVEAEIAQGSASDKAPTKTARGLIDLHDTKHGEVTFALTHPERQGAVSQARSEMRSPRREIE